VLIEAPFDSVTNRRETMRAVIVDEAPGSGASGWGNDMVGGNPASGFRDLVAEDRIAHLVRINLTTTIGMSSGRGRCSVNP